MMKFAFAIGLLASQAALAQPAGMPPPGGLPRHEMLSLAGAELEHGRVVQGAPYCADAVHETVQTLADGNRIVQRRPSRQCRDNHGRTWQEVGSGARAHVYLRDPVAQEAWLLDPVGKHATRLDTMHRGAPLPVPEPVGGAWEQRMREWSRDMREWGRSLRERLRPGEPAAAAPPPPEPPADAPPMPVRIVLGGPHVAELPPPHGAMPPAIAFHARLRAPRGPGVVNALPAETVEGLRAEGRRTTWTVEAGKIGNEKPLVTVREVWTSPELLITLRSRELDPLAGEDNYRVQNLVRAEPDAALFRVPADYRKLTPPTMHLPGPRPKP